MRKKHMKEYLCRRFDFHVNAFKASVCSEERWHHFGSIEAIAETIGYLDNFSSEIITIHRSLDRIRDQLYWTDREVSE